MVTSLFHQDISFHLLNVKFELLFAMLFAESVGQIYVLFLVYEKSCLFVDKIQPDSSNTC